MFIVFFAFDNWVLKNSSPARNLISLLIFIVFAKATFLNFGNSASKSYIYYKTNNFIIFFIITTGLLFFFGVVYNKWSSEENEQTPNSNINWNTFEMRRIIQFPFKEYKKHIGSPDTLKFTKSIDNLDDYYLLMYDKTGSTKIEDSVVRVIRGKIIQLIGSYTCSNSIADSLKKLSYRDLVLLDLIMQINADHAKDTQSAGKCYVQCFCYMGDSQMYQMFSGANIFSWEELNNSKICTVLQNLISGLQKNKTEGDHKTDFYFVSGYLNSKNIVPIDQKSAPYVALGILSDFDNDKSKDDLIYTYIRNKLDSFFSTNRINNLSLLKLKGTNVDSGNQIKTINLFKECYSNHNFKIVDENGCIVSGGYDDFSRSLRKSVSADSMVISFLYPQREDLHSTSAKSVIHFNQDFNGKIKFVTNPLQELKKTSYFVIQDANAKQKLSQNQFAKVSFKANSDYIILYNGLDEIDANICIEFFPDNNSHGYSFRTAFQSYTPPIIAIAFQIAYLLLFMLKMINYTFVLILSNRVATYKIHIDNVTHGIGLILFSFLSIYSLYIYGVFMFDYIYPYLKWYCEIGIVAVMVLYLFLMVYSSKIFVKDKKKYLAFETH